MAHRTLATGDETPPLGRGREGQPFELLLDPSAMLTESMLPAADDHLQRILESLGAHASVGALVLTNLDAPGEGAPLTRGVLDGRALGELARRLCRPGLPVVVLDDDAEGQARLLRDR